VSSLKPVPLKSVSMEIHLEDFTAIAHLTQTYTNDETSPIEAVYIFPIDEAAAITTFEAAIDGRVIQGVVREKLEARQLYDESLCAGLAAYLLEQPSPAVGDVFRMRVGNLPPGATVDIRLTYVTELPIDLGRVRLTVPTTVAPRYSPHVDPAAPEDRHENPEYSARAAYGLAVKVSARLTSSPIVAVESPSHQVKVEIEGSVATATMAADHTFLDRDFVLLVTPSQPHIPVALAERDPASGTSCVALTLVPELPAREVERELVFVVDRSGSMNGRKMEQTRRALQLFLRSIPPGCYFNLVSFGSDVQPWKPASQPYNEDTLREASQYVADMQPSMGGTEILRPLHWVYSQRVAHSAPGRPLGRQVFLLTDGQVGNVMAVTDLVRRHARSARTFALGLGDSVSRHLISSVARAGNGDAQFVLEGERMERKIAQQLKRSLQPAWEDLRIDWRAADVGKPRLPFAVGNSKTAPVHQAPYNLPAIFSGSRFVAYCFLNKGEEVPREVRVSATSSSGNLSLTVPVTVLSPEETGLLFHRLASRTLIRDLEEGNSQFHTMGITHNQEAVDALIVGLGVRYGLVSSRTSFVAVDISTQAELQELPQVRNVPSLANSLSPTPPAASSSSSSASLQESAEKGKRTSATPKLPSQKGIVPRASGLSTPVSRTTMETPPPKVPAPKSKDLSAATREPPPASLSSNPQEDGPSGRRSSSTTSSLSSRSQEKLLDALILLQAASGSFRLTDELARALGTTLVTLTSRRPPSVDGVAVTDDLWATALSLTFLQKSLASLADEWDLIGAKALDYLTKSPLAAAAPKLLELAVGCLVADIQ